jgi:hypothetical protein
VRGPALAGNERGLGLRFAAALFLELQVDGAVSLADKGGDRCRGETSIGEHLVY